SSYNDVAEFFHDEFGGLVICVFLKPSVFENNVRSKDKNLSKQNGVIDINEMIKSWQLLGNGIVKSIRTFAERWPTD
ncbi:unnamed protein product, partial [Didymodactylos carnosus]